MIMLNKTMDLNSFIGHFHGLRFKTWIAISACFIIIANCRFSEEERQFQRKAVKTHNIFRAIHLSPGLKLDIDLTKQARKLANEASKRSGFHNLTAGQNIFQAERFRDVSGKEVTEKW